MATTPSETGKPQPTVERPAGKRSKLCPICAEAIQQDAVKCRFCGEFIAHAQFERPSQKRSIFKRLFSKQKPHQDHFLMIPLDLIESNPYQPREFLDKAALAGLKKSIKEYGVIVPIIVRADGKHYQLVAGQRRLAAARELGLKFIPSLVRNLSVREMMEVGYLENLHRQDLTQIDKIQMFERICTEYPEIGREKLATMLGLSLEDINRDRDVLKMPALLQEALRRGMISLNHARLLQNLNKERLLKAIEEIYQYRLNPEETRDVIGKLTTGRARFVSSQKSKHFHLRECPFATLVDRPQEYSTRKEAVKSGKIACMVCQ